MQKPSCLPVFLYTIAALSESVLYYSIAHNAVFSVWLHASDYKNARDAANLFANTFAYSNQSIKNEHQFHLNTSSKNGHDLEVYGTTFTDVPLLIFSNSKSHKLSSQKTKPILDRKYNENIKFSPVFVSSASTQSFKALPLKIDDIKLKRRDFGVLKECINHVYREFIQILCRRDNIFESADILVCESYRNSLLEILQSPMTYPLFHHHCIVLNCKEEHTPREFIDLNNELSSIRKDIMRFIPEALDIELNISSSFQDFQYDAKKKHGENFIIYMPMLTFDSTTQYESADDNLYDAENLKNELFAVYCKRVISELNKLRKAVCHCTYVYRLRYALEYYNSFMSKAGVDFQFRKDFMAEGYNALDMLLRKQPLLNAVSKEEQTAMEKDINRFLKTLAEIIYKQLAKPQSDVVRNISFRISRGKSCATYEVDSKLFRKLADAQTNIPFRRFLNELAERDILIKNTCSPRQPRFVFQRTVNSRAHNYYVVRAEAIQTEAHELT